MKEIGGYFQLELSSQKASFPHANGIYVNTGRNALEYILQVLSIKKLYIPYFTCDVVLEPLHKLDVRIKYYHINKQLELAESIQLAQDEYLLYTNYFGIKDAYVAKLATHYRERLIVDNAQGFYAPYHKGTQAFYSPRKYVGIPDGGIVYTTSNEMIDLTIDSSFDRCSHLLKRHDLGAGAGYADFKENSERLKMQPIERMSTLTQRLMHSIDFEDIKRQRRNNFRSLHIVLDDSNGLNIPSLDSFACPMVYPYLTTDIGLKQKLIQNKIFVATYWPNVLEWCKSEDIEFQLANKIIAIPIDQRYGTEDMRYLIKMILNNI